MIQILIHPANSSLRGELLCNLFSEGHFHSVRKEVKAFFGNEEGASKSVAEVSYLRVDFADHC